MNVEQAFAMVQARVEAAARRGLDEAAEEVLAESNRHAPIEEGDLSESGKTSRSGDSVAISYDTPYAVKQHESTSLRHDPGRASKFLETAANANRDEIRSTVANEIRRALH